MYGNIDGQEEYANGLVSGRVQAQNYCCWPEKSCLWQLVLREENFIGSRARVCDSHHPVCHLPLRIMRRSLQFSLLFFVRVD
jgi:hypothetical protein